MKNTIFLSVAFLFSFFVLGQDSQYLNIQKAWSKVLKAETEKEKLQLHNHVEGLVGNYLQSFGKENLSQLENFKDLYSSDSSLRIVSWFYQLTKDDFQIHGHIVYKGETLPKGLSFVQIPLNEKNVTIQRDTSYTFENWPAAWYYKIVDKEDRFGKKYYTLIGWIPKNRISQQKIVEVLWFENVKAHFGAPIFDRGQEREYRLLFEYGAQNVMRLSYQEELDQLIMDHLSPPGAEYQGIYEYYGPDFSFDAFRWENDRWMYYPDVDVDEGIDKKKSDFKKKDVILEKKPIYESGGQ